LKDRERESERERERHTHTYAHTQRHTCADGVAVTVVPAAEDGETGGH